jgi:hypothetical protein
MNIIRTLVATAFAAVILGACAEGGPLVPTEISVSADALPPADRLPPLGDGNPPPHDTEDPPYPLPPIEEPVEPEPPLPADPPDDDGTVH